MQAECSIISSISWEAVNVYQALSLFLGPIKSLVDGHGPCGHPWDRPVLTLQTLFLAMFGPCTFLDRKLKVFLTVQFDKPFDGQTSRGSL